ncbi:MAG TPA: hypothetical protein VFG67_07655 [Oleiagrimonas sp.]|nr:hypothetical protein [Oleiagrimonas sp.]
MKRLLSWIIPAMLLVVLTGCSSTPRRSMFPPTLSIQQLHVQPNGQWHMQVRILNNSYGSMEFRALHLTMLINNQPATQIDTSFKLDIPALSADVTDVDIAPSAAARAALAAIADKGSSSALAYTLKGKASAIPEHQDSPRDYDVDSHDWLSAVPGIADTYR